MVTIWEDLIHTIELFGPTSLRTVRVGDSGGPMFTPDGGGYAIVGLTSWGPKGTSSLFRGYTLHLCSRTQVVPVRNVGCNLTDYPGGYTNVGYHSGKFRE